PARRPPRRLVFARLPDKLVSGAAKTYLSRQNRDFLRRASEGLTARINGDRRRDRRKPRRNDEETEGASAEPGGGEPVGRPSRQVRRPEARAARTHEADPQGNPYWRTAHGHRPDATGTRRTSPVAALAGRSGAHRGRGHAARCVGRGFPSRTPVPVVRPASPGQAYDGPRAARGARARAGRLLTPGPAAPGQPRHSPL